MCTLNTTNLEVSILALDLRDGFEILVSWDAFMMFRKSCLLGHARLLMLSFRHDIYLISIVRQHIATRPDLPSISMLLFAMSSLYFFLWATAIVIVLENHLRVELFLIWARLL